MAFAFGVTAFVLVVGGLVFSVDGWSCDLTEYGPAVAGRGAMSGRLLAGLTGATDRPLEPTASVDSCFDRTAGAAAVEVVDVVDVLDAFRTGEK